MFDVRLYKTNSKTLQIGKVLTDEKVKRGLWQEATSFLHPTFRFAKDDDLLSYNYAYIPRFNRYYFITDVIPDGVYTVCKLDVDPLESNKENILNSTQLIGRQEKDFNLYLIDSEIPAYQSEKYATDLFPLTPFNTDGIKLLTGKIFTLVTGGPGAPA